MNLRSALADGGWLLSLIAVALALFAIYLALPQAGIDTRVNDRVIINVPREITAVQPADVACTGQVTVSDSAVSLFYRATLGNFVLTWTQPLDKMAFTDGKVVDYPVADKTTTDCLAKRARKVSPAQ